MGGLRPTEVLGATVGWAGNDTWVLVHARSQLLINS